MNSRRFLVSVLAFLVLIAFGLAFSGWWDAPPSLKDRRKAAREALPAPERFSIESVLEREDLNKKARQLFLERQASGDSKLTVRQIERVIARSLVITPSRIPGTLEPRAFRAFPDGSHWEANYEEFLWRSKSFQTMLPSLSAYDAPSGEADDPQAVPTSIERFVGKYDFYRIGIDHFLKKELPKISKQDQRTVADYMNQVFDALPRESKKETWADLSKEAKTLAAKHQSLASEGMFLLCRGIAGQNNKESGPAKYQLLKALEQFGTDDCPTRCAVFTHYRLNSHFKRESESAREKRYRGSWVAMKYWLEKDYRATESEQKYVLEVASSIVKSAVVERDAKLIEDFMVSIEANPKLTPWLRSMLLGRYNLDMAWRYRGNRYASSVSKEGMQKFEDYSKIAHTHFEAAYEFNPKFPEAAAELISISKTGHSTETAEHWFEKATEHEVGYIPAHNNLMVALLPKWGGSHKRAFDFAAELAKEGFAADAPEACSPTVMANLIEAVLKIRNPYLKDEGKWGEFFTQDDRADIVLQALDWLIDSEQEVIFLDLIRAKDYWLTYKAILATEADQGQRADEAFQHLKAYNSNALYMLTGTSRSFEADRAHAYLHSSEYGADVKELKKLVGDDYETRHKNWRRILDIATPLAESVSLDTGGWFFRNLVDQIQKERDFRKGKEVKLLFTPDFGQWKVRDDRQVKYISPDEIEIDNRKHDSRFYMNSHLSFRSDDEEQEGRQVDFDISFVSDEEVAKKERAYIASKNLTLALQTHAVAFHGSPNDQFLVGLKRDSKNYFPAGHKEGKGPGRRMGKLVFGPYTARRHRFDDFRTHLPNPVNHLSIRYTGNVLEMYLNGEFICRTWSMAFKGCYSIVSFVVPTEYFYGRGVVRVSNIRVKPWEAPPLALKDEKIIKHYQDRLKAAPTSRWDEFWLGHIYHRSKSFDKAILHYEKSIELGMRNSHVAFYIGDIYENQGDWENAQKWYQTSVREAPEVYPEVIHYPADRFGPMERDSYPEDWARFRLRWHESMTAGNTLEARKLGTPERELRVPANIKGTLLLVESQYIAAAGDWETAIKKLEPFVNQVPQKHRPFFKKFMASYRKQEIYVVTDEELALPLGNTIFFRHFEERLPVGRKLMHRQEPRADEK